MNTSAEYTSRASCTSVSPATVDFFALNLTAWRPDTFTDPTGGGNMTVRGFVYINAKDGSALTSNICWFTFQRYLGVVTARVDQSTGSAGNLASAVSGSTAKLQFTAPLGHTIDYDGVVYWAAHY